MDFATLKTVHVTTVALSYLMFLVRGIGMLADSPWLSRRWVRVVPHVNDTVLLAAGIGLALMLHQYPGVHGWLTAKVAGLVVYIALGTLALRRGPRAKRARLAAWLAAQAVFGYIVAVALTHDPWPVRSFLR